MADQPTVLLATEGTYPYYLGGVSTWCDSLVRSMEDVNFILYAVTTNPYVSSRFPLPPQVKQIVNVPLWGMQDPSEHKKGIPFSEIFLNKHHTTPEYVEQTFIPMWTELLNQVAHQGGAPDVLGQVLVGMYRYFRHYDYLITLKSPAVWRVFNEWIAKNTRDSLWEEPTVFETVQAAGWLYHFMIVLNTNIPPVDLVHSSAAAFCGLSGILAKLFDQTPYLLTEHGVYLREQYLSIGRSDMPRFSKRFMIYLIQTLVRANLYYADEIVPVCNFNARWERLLGAEPQKIHVIYNGVNPETFQPALALTSDTEEIAPSADEDEGFHILSIARIDPNKDLETLLHAVSIVKRRIPRVRVDVYGAVSVPAYYDRILQLRAELGLEEAVQFAGHVDDVAATYRESDVVIQSSVSEAFPYSVLEAMMSGVPVVATDVGGTSEALADAGILIPARDPVRMALSLIILGENRKLRLQLGAASRERALSWFTIPLMVDQFRRQYYRMAQIGPATEDPRRTLILIISKALALVRLGMDSAAVSLLQEALGLSPQESVTAFILSQLGRAEQRLGRPEGTMHLIAAWILLHPHATSPLNP